MENNSWDPAQAAAALDDAEASSGALAGALRPRTGFFASLGLVIAVNIALTAVGIAEQRLSLLIAGAAVFGAVAAVELLWTRRATGVWVAAFANRVVLGNGPAASAAYVAGLAAAAWAAFAESWVLVGTAAAAAGAAYAWAGWHWLRRYRDDPGSSPRALPWRVEAVMVVVALAGLAALVLAS